MAKILIIDDEQYMINSIRRILEQEGYDVIEAPNGVEGMKMLHRNTVDLVITDMYMPEQDGIETIRDIRRHYPDVKVVAISGGGEIGSFSPLDAVRIIWAHEVFVKPFDSDEIIESVRKLVG